MINKYRPLALVGVLVLAACGGGSESSSDTFDADRACRIAQRLVDETADGDREGVVKQVERLDELDGIADSGLDVDDLDAMAEELDENAVDDLIAEFDSIDCDLDRPDFADDPETASTEPGNSTTDPASSDPTVTHPPATDPPASDPVVTDPPPSDPPATDPPDGDPEVTPPPGDTPGTPVDIGSTGPGSEDGVNRPTEAIISEFEMEGMIYSPNTNVTELSIDRSDFSFGGDPEWSNWNTITMSAATSMPLEDIRGEYKAAIESSGIAFDITESTSSSDGTRSVGLEADSTEYDPVIPRWDIEISESDDAPGVVLIEVQRNVTVVGALPPIPAPAQALLADTAQLGADLGWTISSYRLSRSANTFSGGTFEFGSVRWDISEEDTLVASADALKVALGGGPFDNEEASADSVTFFLPTDESPLFSVRYSEFSGTTASFTT